MIKPNSTKLENIQQNTPAITEMASDASRSIGLNDLLGGGFLKTKARSYYPDDMSEESKHMADFAFDAIETALSYFFIPVKGPKLVKAVIDLAKLGKITNSASELGKDLDAAINADHPYFEDAFRLIGGVIQGSKSPVMQALGKMNTTRTLFGGLAAAHGANTAKTLYENRDTNDWYDYAKGAGLIALDGLATFDGAKSVGEIRRMIPSLSKPNTWNVAEDLEALNQIPKDFSKTYKNESQSETIQKGVAKIVKSLLRDKSGNKLQENKNVLDSLSKSIANEIVNGKFTKSGFAPTSVKEINNTILKQYGVELSDPGNVVTALIKKSVDCAAYGRIIKPADIKSIIANSEKALQTKTSEALLNRKPSEEFKQNIKSIGKWALESGMTVGMHDIAAASKSAQNVVSSLAAYNKDPKTTQAELLAFGVRSKTSHDSLHNYLQAGFNSDKYMRSNSEGLGNFLLDQVRNWNRGVYNKPHQPVMKVFDATNPEVAKFQVLPKDVSERTGAIRGDYTGEFAFGVGDDRVSKLFESIYKLDAPVNPETGEVGKDAYLDYWSKMFNKDAQQNAPYLVENEFGDLVELSRTKGTKPKQLAKSTIEEKARLSRQGKKIVDVIFPYIEESNPELAVFWRKKFNISDKSEISPEDYIKIAKGFKGDILKWLHSQTNRKDVYSDLPIMNAESERMFRTLELLEKNDALAPEEFRSIISDVASSSNNYQDVIRATFTDEPLQNLMTKSKVDKFDAPDFIGNRKSTFTSRSSEETLDNALVQALDSKASASKMVTTSNNSNFKHGFGNGSGDRTGNTRVFVEKDGKIYTSAYDIYEINPSNLDATWGDSNNIATRLLAAATRRNDLSKTPWMEIKINPEEVSKFGENLIKFAEDLSKKPTQVDKSQLNEELCEIVIEFVKHPEIQSEFKAYQSGKLRRDVEWMRNADTSEKSMPNAARLLDPLLKQLGIKTSNKNRSLLIDGILTLLDNKAFDVDKSIEATRFDKGLRVTKLKNDKSGVRSLVQPKAAAGARYTNTYDRTAKTAIEPKKLKWSDELVPNASEQDKALIAFKLFGKSKGSDEYRARDAMDLRTYRKIKYHTNKTNKSTDSKKQGGILKRV